MINQLTRPVSSQSLAMKYASRSVHDLLLAPKTRERLVPFIDFLANPRPMAWLFHGDTGVGKTSLATISAELLRDELGGMLIQESGPRVLDQKVDSWAQILCENNLLGSQAKIVFIDEADGISAKAKESLRTVIETSFRFNTYWLFTSNKNPDSFGKALKSRMQAIHFSEQGLAPILADRLVEVARIEGACLSQMEAMAIVRQQASDIRASLNALELTLVARKFQCLVNTPSKRGLSPAVKEVHH